MTNSTQECRDEFEKLANQLCHSNVERALVYMFWQAALTRRAPETVEGGSVPMPQNEAQAELMQKLGYAWLEQNAPHRLVKHQPVTTGVEPTSAGMSDELFREKLAAYFDAMPGREMFGNTIADEIRRFSSDPYDHRSESCPVCQYRATTPPPDTAVQTIGGKEYRVHQDGELTVGVPVDTAVPVVEKVPAPKGHILSPPDDDESPASVATVQMPKPVAHSCPVGRPVYAFTFEQIQSYGEACAAEARAEMQNLA